MGWLPTWLGGSGGTPSAKPAEDQVAQDRHQQETADRLRDTGMKVPATRLEIAAFQRQEEALQAMPGAAETRADRRQQDLDDVKGGHSSISPKVAAEAAAACGRHSGSLDCQDTGTAVGAATRASAQGHAAGHSGRGGK